MHSEFGIRKTRSLRKKCRSARNSFEQLNPRLIDDVAQVKATNTPTPWTGCKSIAGYSSIFSGFHAIGSLLLGVAKVGPEFML